MADGIDIGALSGRIEFEDHVSATMDLVLRKVDALEDGFTGMGHRVAESAAGFFTAELALHAVEKAADKAIEVFKDLTIEGAGIGDIEENFHRLTDEAGRLSSTLLGELRTGTHNTIDDLELMKTLNRDLAAGMKLTDGQFRAVANGAFALAQATGGDVKSAFDTMNDALLTGRTRSLQMLTGHIDLSQAEQNLAEKLGVTVDKLSEEGKLQAARTAILDSVSAATKRLGEQTDGLDELVAQAQTTWSNFYDDLAKTVGTSPHIIAAYNAIKNALVEAFGGDKQDMVKTFAGWIDRGADAVATYGPVVIQAFADVKDWVVDVYSTIKAGWDTLPDWFKNAAVNSALAVAGFSLFNSAAKQASGGMIDFIGTAGNLTTWFSGMPTALANVNAGLTTMGNLVRVMDFTSFSNMRASINLVGESVVGFAGKLGLVGIAIGAVMAAWEVGKMQSVSDFFEGLGLRLTGYSSAEADAMVKTHHLTDEQAAQAEQTKQQQQAMSRFQEEMKRATQATNDHAGAQHNDEQASEKNRLTLAKTSEEIKKMKEALEEVKSSSKDFHETVKALDKDMVTAIKQYLEAGVAQDKLATVYGLTATQINAIAKALKEEQEAAKLEARQVIDSTERWVEYYSLRRSMSGTVTDQTIADIESWKAAQVKSHQAAKTDTADFYTWLEQMESAQYEKSDKDRLEADVHSKAHWEALKVDAQDAYQYALMHSDQFTQGYIDGLRRTMEESTRAAEHWRDTTGKELDRETEQARELAAQMHAMGNTQEVTSQDFSEKLHQVNTFGGFSQLGHFDEAKGYALAKAGYSFEEIVRILENKGGGPIPPPQGPRIPGFREGGIGDFGDGTLAMLHGKEAIVPLDGHDAIGGGQTVNIFHVNGTAEDVAHKIADIMMQRLKQGQRFSRS